MTILNTFVLPLLLGAVSSLIVAYAFYRFGKDDLIKIHKMRHLDFISSKLHLLDPRDFNGNIYGDLGVGRTSHLFKCEASVMDEYHFHDGAQIVRTISDEMLRLCPDVNIGQSISAATAEEEKVKWKKSIAQLQKTLSPKKTDCNICKHKLR